MLSVYRCLAPTEWFQALKLKPKVQGTCLGVTWFTEDFRSHECALAIPGRCQSGRLALPISGLQPPHFQSFITRADLRQIARWGMDHVRLPVDYPVVEDDSHLSST